MEEFSGDIGGRQKNEVVETPYRYPSMRRKMRNNKETPFGYPSMRRKMRNNKEKTRIITGGVGVDYGNVHIKQRSGKRRHSEKIKTVYQGNQFVIYYDTNEWDFTRLGKINDITAKELKKALGKGSVTVTLSLD